MSAGAEDRGLEDRCPSCGAMVRRGLVRCWNCSAFMRPDIAAKYEKMRAKQPDVSFQPLPEHGSSAAEAHAKESIVEGDDGFEMAEGAGKEGDFELGASFTAAEPEDRSRKGASAFTGGPRAKSKSKSADKESPGDEADAPTKESAPSDEAEETSEAPSAEQRKKRKQAVRGKSDDVAHSEATGGDALLQVALQEEKETGRHGRRAAIDPVAVEGGWMITCPCPAHVRIKIRESHRGKTGKCPNPECGSYFTVPANLPAAETEADSTAEGESHHPGGIPTDPAEKAGPYTHWLRDVRLHVVKPAKAKRKPGGHEKEFQPTDLGFAQTEGIAAISLAGKASGFMGKPPNPEEVREEVTGELRDGKPSGELSSNAVFTFAPEVLEKMIVEYPPAYEHESTFAGTPVFGGGYIAVKLPPAGAEDEQHFLALTLTKYRKLARLLEGLYEIDQLGFACPIPDDDDVVNLECHYSEDMLRVLRDPTFHRADPEISLEVAGYRCGSCGLIVSENSRKKEKIGGLEGKKLGSAKCPKCKGKFGKNALYALASADGSEDAKESSEEESVQHAESETADET